MLDIPTEENTMTFTKFAVAAAAALLCAGSVIAAPVEGTDYVVLEKPIPNASGTFIKVYSYDCPFCFKYDVGVDPKVLPRIEKETGLAFNPIHLETKGKYGRIGSEFLAMCLLRDKAAGVSVESKDSLFKKAKDAVYVAYHKKGERWTSGEAAFLKTMTDATGISADEFAKAKNDPAVKAMCDEWKLSYDVAKIQGIPAYVVNGKYLIMTKSIRSLDGMVELVKELKEMK